MTPAIRRIERPGTPTIGKIKASHLSEGTWFLGRLEMRGEPKLYLRAFDTTVDVQTPLNTYGVDQMFFDVREVGARIEYWTL